MSTHPFGRLSFRCLPIVALLALGSCQGAASLLYEPKPNDPLDGYAGSLAQAGINTEMDWGPKQNLLLSEFKTLKEEHTRLEKRLEQIVAENQNLKNQVNNDGKSLQAEKTARMQTEAQLEQKQQKLRENEATILSLRIEKAKLEQQNLLAKIDVLKATMDQSVPTNVEAAATPPGNR